MSIMMEAYLRAAGISTPMGRVLDKTLSEAKAKGTMFGYYINKNERGDFYADVRDADDNTVYEVKSDDETGGVPEVEDGFMRNTSDIGGLEKHLKSMNIIDHKATLMDASDFEDELSQIRNAIPYED